MNVLITGASRGVGRGIALAFADIGADIILTGRTVNGPLSIEETAKLVSERGGKAIAFRCDHRENVEVGRLPEVIASVFDSQIDVLVNNVWGGNEIDQSEKPFWEQNLEANWTMMIDSGVRAHYLTTCHCIPYLNPNALVITTGFWDDDKYAHSLLYDLALHSMNRFALGLSKDFIPGKSLRWHCRQVLCGQKESSRPTNRSQSLQNDLEG